MSSFTNTVTCTSKSEITFRELQSKIEELEKLLEKNIKTEEIDSRQLAEFAADWDKIIEILNDDNKGPTCKLQKIREVVE
jgi:hypothetical protein